MKNVSYKKKIYRVIEEQFCGNKNLYKLASRTQDGSPFPASKSDCIEVVWAEHIHNGRWVTIPE